MIIIEIQHFLQSKINPVAGIAEKKQMKLAVVAKLLAIVALIANIKTGIFVIMLFAGNY